jgi:hypothetical protein
MADVQTWGFESARPDGTGVFVRLTCLPARNIAWYWAYLFVPDVGLVVVRDHEVPLPRRTAPDLEVRADALWAELVCETPGEHWGIGLEAFGVVLDDPWDALRGELGTRVPVGLDLEWEVIAPAHRDDAAASEHQFGRIHGELLLGAERILFDAAGARDVAAGDLTAAPGAHRSAFAIGEALAAQVVIRPGPGAGGYVWRLGEDLAAVREVLVEEHPAPPAVPAAVRYVLDGTLEVDAEVASVAVIPLGDTYLLQALCRFTAADGDGDEAGGAGFARWICPIGSAPASLP